MAVQYCAECHVYMGSQPTDPRVPVLLSYPHFVWCSQAIRDERERMLDEMTEPFLGLTDA